MSQLYYYELTIRGVNTRQFDEVHKAVQSCVASPCIVDMRPTKTLDEAVFSGWTDVFSEGGTTREHGEFVTAIAKVAPGAKVETRWLYWEDIHWDAEHGVANDEDEE